MNENEGKDAFLRILGENIKQERKKKDFSQEELAKRSGYTTDNARSTISKIENGINDVPVSKLKDIAKALNVSVCDLIQGTEHVQKEMLLHNLLAECYGSQTYELIKLFTKLNNTGQSKVLADLSDLVQLPKYTDEEKRESAKMA